MFPKIHRQLIENLSSLPPELVIPKTDFRLSIDCPSFSFEANPKTSKLTFSDGPISVNSDNGIDILYNTDYIRLSTKAILPLSLYIGSKNTKIKLGSDSLGLSLKTNFGYAKSYYNCKVINGVATFSQIRDFGNLTYGFFYYNKFISPILQYQTKMLKFGMALTFNNSFLPQIPLFLSVEAKNDFSKIQLFSGSIRPESLLETRVIVSFFNEQFKLTGMFQDTYFPIVSLQKNFDWGNVSHILGHELSVSQMVYKRECVEFKARLGYHRKKYIYGLDMKLIDKQFFVKRKN